MPTYQYACTECGHRLEVVQSFSDDPLAVCPICGGRLRKVFSPVGIVFKGSGFYRTDSRGKDRAAAAADSGSSDGAGKSEHGGKEAVAASSPEGSGPPGPDKAGSGSGKAGPGSSGSGSNGPRSAGSRTSGDKSSPAGSKVA